MEELALTVDVHWTSPYAFSAFVALREKGLPFDVEPVALQRKEHHRPDYLATSLTGRVPRLRHRDFWLSESSAIDEYLEDAFPPPRHPRLFPADIRERARARQLMAWVRSDLMPIREERPTYNLFYERTSKPLSARAEGVAARLLAVADALLAPGRTTLFAAWCIADTDFALMLQRLLVNGHPAPAKIQAFVDAQWARPSVRAWLDQKRPTYEPY
ncbi:MAG TPA: glutathione transferase [Myxococcaceae bacterium]|jgi:glutathione S-transferase|nr:glutathione transferase [Myxococcaceae bacterium]